MNEPILVIGANGLLGSAIVGACKRQGWAIQGTTRQAAAAGSTGHTLDLSEPADRWKLPTGVRSAVLCAGITRLDACLRDPEGTRKINVDQTLLLADRLTKDGVFVVYLSSNLVFDGERPQCLADAERRPRTEYGRQKLAVEEGLQKLGDRVAVIRLTKVVHPGWALITGWKEALKAGQKIRPYAGMVCSPVAIDDVAFGVAKVARGGWGGVWQFSGADDIGYDQIAADMAHRLRSRLDQVDPVPLGEAKAAEPWPKHTTLDARRAQTELGMSFPPALEVMRQTFQW